MAKNLYVPLASKPHKSGLLSIGEVIILLMANFPIAKRTCYDWRKSATMGFPKPVGPGSRPFYNEAEVIAWVIDYRQKWQRRQ